VKCVLICYNAGLHEDVLEALHRADVSSYSRWEQILGSGQSSGQRLNSSIWPGFNSAMAVVVDDDRKDAVMSEIRLLRKEHSKEGVKAFVLPVEEMT